MKRRINLVFLLLTLCAFGVIGFQFYWNYQAYKSSTKRFKTEISVALQEAVHQEIEERKTGIIKQYQSWLADTNLVSITCRLHPIYQNTLFQVVDKNFPPTEKREPFSMSFATFKPKLNAITPAAKAYFIEHFTTRQIRQDLDNGAVFYYTYNLGKKMGTALAKSQVDTSQLLDLYAADLSKRDIPADFKLVFGRVNPVTSAEVSFRTQVVSTHLPSFDESKIAVYPASHTQTKAQREAVVYAAFPDPNLVFVKQMKWVLGTSLLLAIIVIGCFGYTIKTILDQKKLAQLKDDFVNNITHELQTPVATISIAAEAIQSFGLSPVASEEYVGIIRQQSGRLAHLIDQILKGVLLEQTKEIKTFRRLNLPALLERILIQMKPSLETSGAALRVDCPDKALFILGDELHLTNLISTLLDNALKYRREKVEITIGCAAQAGNVILTLTDNGIGISEAYQKRVFEKFFRVPAGDVHNVKGYGLGLSYAKAVVEQHAGSITLKSQENAGTTFIIQLPLAADETV